MDGNERASVLNRAGDLVAETLVLDRGSENPLFQQVYEQIRELIVGRSLQANMALPSTRALAKDLHVARNTVMIAYGQLETEGYVTTARGARARVAELPDLQQAESIMPLPDLSSVLSKRGKTLVDLEHQTGFEQPLRLQPGLPDNRDFPSTNWRRAMSHQWPGDAGKASGYHSHGGDSGLRRIVSDYMRASRGLKCQPEQVMITTGAQGAFNLLSQLLIDPGDKIMMEDPGYTGARGAFLAAGAQIEPLKVDDKSWDLDSIGTVKPKFIYVTPSCQFPLGQIMRIEQRLSLLKKARDANAWVIEDDFDSEFSFLKNRLSTLQQNDTTGRTIYVGSFSKTMIPDLRVGFVIFPGKVVKNLRKASFLLATHPPLSIQRGVARFIQEGHFTRHVKSTKRIYDQKRQKLVQIILNDLGDKVTQLDDGSGLQTVWKFNVSVDDKEVARRALEKGIGPTPLSIHFYDSLPVSGLMIGYATTEDSQFPAAVKTLRKIIEDCC
ncbi:PLP-dependent aminotransferase family protein [Rhodobacteraceae bacterium nBUS_24]